MSIDVNRAHVDFHAIIKVTTDGQLTVSLPACGARMAFAAATTERRI
jgi:hypothetical protein